MIGANLNLPLWLGGQSDGQKALTLLLTQPDWTHRRVETFSLESHGETRQRISWDFTLPAMLTIGASLDQVAVPLATLAKQPLKRLSVTDAEGRSLPIWGTEDNGRLAAQALAAGLAGALGRMPTKGERALLTRIVMAKAAELATGDLNRLATLIEEKADAEQGAVLFALAQDLAANFLLVVEMSRGVKGTRSLVKLQHAGDIGQGEEVPALASVHETWIDGAAWSSTASWHLEIQAPPGLAIHNLRAVDWDEDQQSVVQVGSSSIAGHTAHLSGSTTSLGSLSWAELELRPARAGLVNQTLLAASVALMLLTAGCFWDAQLFKAISEPDRASAIAAVMLAVPALLIALIARGPEHRVVSRLLLLPRLLNIGIATILLATAASLVLGLPESGLTWTLRALLAVQLVFTVAAVWIYARSVGGHS